MRAPLLLLLLPLRALAARPAAAQPTHGAAAPADYDGPCHSGALPAVFDDFEYASGAASGRLDPTRRGAFFGENVWHTREGTTASRAWYRTNRDDLPIPGSLTFDDSVLEMRLPAGLTPEEYPRSAIVLSGFTMRGGTYRWRVRLSEQWEGQSLRHSVWLTSPDRYYFHRPTSDGDTIRLDYWSELDFEN
ncbi:MAG: hypothetical protein R3362_06975, partial [Rhodothermales bacterium]|nr:hypothetical protein [Rhodothermales bacterium]